MNNFNIFSDSGLQYLFSNVIVLLIIVVICWIGLFIQKQQVKNLSTHTITIVAVLLAFSVAINSMISHLSILKWKVPGFCRFQFEFKGVMLFAIGMIYGPFFGFTAVFCNNLLGLVLKFKGSFHLGFTLCDILYGFIGGLVFLFNKKKSWYLKTLLIFSFLFIFQSLLLKPLFLYCSGWHKITIVKSFIIRLIKLPFAIVIDNFIVILLFRTIYKIIVVRYNQDI